MSKKPKSLQTKIAELEELVAYFSPDNEKFQLDEGIEKFRNASALADEVEKELTEYRTTIDEITLKFSPDNE